MHDDPLRDAVTEVFPSDIGVFSVHTPFVIDDCLFFSASRNGGSRERDYTIWLKRGDACREVIRYEKSLCGPWVVRVGELYRLYVAVLWNDQPRYSIISFVSTDLENWAFETVVMEGNDYYQSVTSPCVIQVPGKFIMFYTGQPEYSYAGRDLALVNTDTFVAVSDDGVHFTEGELLGIDRDEDCLQGQYKPNVFWHQDRYLLYLSGLRDDHRYCIIIYESPDLSDWRKRQVIVSRTAHSVYKPVQANNRLLYVERDRRLRSSIKSCALSTILEA